MFQDGVSTVVTFLADVEDNHWRTYFEYNKGAFELIKVEHKGKYNGNPSLSTEDYQDITTIEGFTSFDNFKDVCFATRNSYTFNFELGKYKLDVDTQNNTYIIEFPDGLDFKLEGFGIIDKNGIETNYFDSLTYKTGN